VTGTRFVEARVQYSTGYGGAVAWQTPSWIGSLGTRAHFVTGKDAPTRGYHAKFFRFTGTLPGGAYGTQQYVWNTLGSLNTRLTTIGSWT
jgi:hypothetical protein